jgi:hypothetical protein
MRTLLITTLAAAGLLSLAACGPEPTPNGASDQVTTTVDTSRTTEETPEPPVSRTEGNFAVPAGVTQVPADQVDASALPPSEYDEHGLVWSFDDGYSLQAYAMATSGCGGVEAVLLDQSATEVRIELGTKDSSSGNQACTDAITAKPVTVALDAPLGDRMVVLES